MNWLMLRCWCTLEKKTCGTKPFLCWKGFRDLQRIIYPFLVSYNTTEPLQRLIKHLRNVFEGFVVLYETKKGYIIRCKSLNPFQHKNDFVPQVFFPVHMEHQYHQVCVAFRPVDYTFETKKIINYFPSQM
jgi:hypothetical protein